MRSVIERYNTAKEETHKLGDPSSEVKPVEKELSSRREDSKTEDAKTLYQDSKNMELLQTWPLFLHYHNDILGYHWLKGKQKPEGLGSLDYEKLQRNKKFPSKNSSF
ncbi:hypothetical protein HAX54_000020 [Datura stramonium]|uniref:Uncharacterized protein n=1 Tax=Datura stramonium TaxID=4076 RepID=A0ABS8RFN1_DATST|nr:hypothetical protein [Datura stramonium]